MIKNFCLILVTLLFLGCSLPYLDAPKPESRCVNIFYFHTRNGFSAGIYLLTGTLYEFSSGYGKFPAEAMVLDTKWVDYDHRCKDPTTLKEKWYVVFMPNEYIFYGTGGVQGTVYVVSQSLPERELKDAPCFGYGCKKSKGDTNAALPMSFMFQ